jgi:hypothetical protein
MSYACGSAAGLGPGQYIAMWDPQAKENGSCAATAGFDWSHDRYRVALKANQACLGKPCSRDPDLGPREPCNS